MVWSVTFGIINLPSIVWSINTEGVTYKRNCPTFFGGSCTVECPMFYWGGRFYEPASGGCAKLCRDVFCFLYYLSSVVIATNGFTFGNFCDIQSIIQSVGPSSQVQSVFLCWPTLEILRVWASHKGETNYIAYRTIKDACSLNLIIILCVDQ